MLASTSRSASRTAVTCQESRRAWRRLQRIRILTTLTSILLPGLRMCRREAKVRQIELAGRVGLRPKTICRIEKKHQSAGLETLQRTAAELGVTAAQLTGDAQWSQPHPPTER